MATASHAGPDVGRGLVLSAPGFIVLAHEHLDRAAALARHLALAGPVVLHADAKVPAGELRNFPEAVRVISTRRCHWGMMGLVDAALDAARILLERSDVSHVCLLSGSCLPVRPLSGLSGFLAAHPGTDFIDSHPVGSDWVQGGLGAERFTLYFPVGWKSRRRVFDWLVDIQRYWRIRRRMPEGLEPRIGLQWWCLSRETLARILDHPRLPEWRRYFKWTWIPDESFFQTLVHHVATGTVHSEPLTLQRFDRTGRPQVFHDDHAAMLESSRHFFARKIDPDASALYDRFLSESVHYCASSGAASATTSRCRFDIPRGAGDAEDRGLLNASRMPWGTSATRVETARPYFVLVSEDHGLLDEIRLSYRSRKTRLHGRVFGPAPAQLAGDLPAAGMHGPGCLPIDPVQRDYRAAQYLARLIWAGRDRPSAFLFDPADNPLIRAHILSDPNARIVLIGNAEHLSTRLAEPPRNRRGQPVAAAERRAWFRAIHAREHDAVRQTLGVLDADPDNPSGWNTPDDAEYPP